MTTTKVVRVSLLAGAVRRGAAESRTGHPWGLSLEDRILLVAVHWRTDLTMRQLALPFAISKSAADRGIGHIGPMPACRPDGGSRGALC